MMNDHPDYEEILQYLDTPDAREFQAFRKHLLYCMDCRDRTQHAANVYSLLPEIPKLTLEYSAELPEDVIDLLNCVTNQDNRRELSNIFQEKPEYIKPALHYTLNANLMLSSLNESKKAPATESLPLKTSLTEKIRNLLNSGMPAWANIPITATAVFAVVVVTNLQTQKIEPEVITYQNADYVSFQSQTKPGIGFFNSASEEKQAFRGVSTFFDKQQNLVIQWPKIPGAVEYTIKVSATANNQQEIITHTTTQKEQITIIQSALSNGRHYNWNIYGTTSTNKQFSVNGGFLIKR